MGTGSSWPQDLRFFAGFFSSSSGAGVPGSSDMLWRVVCDGEMVKESTSEHGVPGNEASSSAVKLVSIAGVYVGLVGDREAVYRSFKQSESTSLFDQFVERGNVCMWCPQPKL